MIVRRYKIGEEKVLWNLFFNTIRSVNIRDYSKEQVEAWAPISYDSKKWKDRFKEMNPFVVILEGNIVAYSSLDSTGYIDHFFCHHFFQGMEIGRFMIENIFSEAKDRKLNRLTVHSSITARPFFEKFGFSVLKEQEVFIDKIPLRNFVMGITLRYN